MTLDTRQHVIAVVGAGPAGLFAAQVLSQAGMHVALLNRDLRPGGLAEYGIYFEKHKIKAALRKQFTKILDDPHITYFGNVTVGEDGDITLESVLNAGFGAVVTAVGAQGTKWLGLPGEDLAGVYHAKDIIYFYNGLPPFSEQQFVIGKRLALIGVGNVMADIAHWAVRTLKVDEVTAVARRGPAEVKFTRQEMEYIANNLDITALDAEIERVAARMRAVGQDPEESRTFLLSALPKALEPVSDTRLGFRFLSSPNQILGDASGHVCGLVVDDTQLELRSDGSTRPTRTGTTYTLDVDTVIFCIGDKVSESYGLPVEWNSFVKHPHPRHPIAGISYEAYDPTSPEALEGVFVVGWAREASTGQVGLARKDAIQCAKAVVAYLETKATPSSPEAVLSSFKDMLSTLDKPVIDKYAAQRLAQAEMEQAREQNCEGFRYTSNADMLKAMEL
ncbi:MAG: FAD-dependent oxidoreductase [Anaerolineae bacterium]|nr:FAD-dependent oxidoreductase [Anaerolineae bacterium]